MINMKKPVWLATLSVCAGGFAFYKYRFRMPLKEYTQYALYMAVLDDEIARNTLKGCIINGKRIEFPPKAASLQYRYHLFLQLNRKKTRKHLQNEIYNMEQRLTASKQTQQA